MVLTAEEKKWTRILQDRPSLVQLLRAAEDLDPLEIEAAIVYAGAIRIGADEVTAAREAAAYLQEHGKPESAERLVRNYIAPLTGIA